MNQIIKIGETPLDLDSGTVISTTKRVANIGTLERQSSFTNKLNLPATANNLAAIGMVQGSDNSTKKYIKQIGSVSTNGIEIMNGAQFSFESLSDRLEVLINSDNAVFFDAIKKTLLREIDLSELDHLWTKAEVINSINNTYEDGYIYALHDSGWQSQFNGSLNCYGIVPSIFVKYLFQKIGETFGYTFTGNIWNESYFENLLIPAVNCFVGARNIEELKCNFITNTSVLLPNTASTFDTYDFFDVVENPTGGAFIDKWNVNPIGNIYYIQIPGTYNVVLNYKAVVSPISVGNLVSAAFKIKAVQTLNNETTILGEQTISTAFSGPFEGELVLNVAFDAFVETTLNPNVTGSENTLITIYLEYESIFSGLTRTNLQVNELSFNIKEIQNAPVSHYNRLYNIQANLPNWSCGKFIREVSNLFGIIPIVNEYTREIRLMLLNELNENKPIAKEWQSKIDLTNDPVYTFKIEGYGQKNKFEYLPDGEQFNYEIDIVNESLPKEVDYIKSEFTYSIYSRILRKTFNTVFLDNYNVETDLNSDYTYSNMLLFNGNPRICFLFRQDTQLIYSSFGESNVIRTLDIPFLGFESQSFLDFNLEWEYLYKRFYESLFNGITDNILKIELDFRLTEFDIQDFDFSIPIYLQNPSGYYYVQEIKDFTSSRESTSVELLRIG
jgi:hypothetical protein